MSHSTTPSTRKRRRLAGISLLALSALPLSACGHTSSTSAPSLSVSTSTNSSTSTTHASPDTSGNSPTKSLEHIMDQVTRDIATSTKNATASATTQDSTTKSSTSTNTGSGSSDTSSSSNSRSSTKNNDSSSSSPSESATSSHASGSSSSSHDSTTVRTAAARAAVSTSMAKQGSTKTSASGRAVRIDAPSIGLHHSITPLGLTSGVLTPAPYQLGEFRGYGRVNPGDVGIAVLAGHVTYNGPDVLYNLKNLAPGATFTITYANGGAKTFRVTNKASIDKNSMEHDQRVWGSSKQRVVAIMSCDAASAWVGLHHTNNLVVWAVQV